MRLGRIVIQFGVVAMLLSLSFSVEAQQPPKIPRIGYISGTADSSRHDSGFEAFRQGLHDLG